MHVCAWCNRKLGIRPGTVRGVPETNYGMCSVCLAERLVTLVGTQSWTPHKPSQPLGPGVNGLAVTRRLREAL